MNVEKFNVKFKQGLTTIYSPCFKNIKLNDEHQQLLKEELHILRNIFYSEPFQYLLEDECIVPRSLVEIDNKLNDMRDFLEICGVSTKAFNSLSMERDYEYGPGENIPVLTISNDFPIISTFIIRDNLISIEKNPIYQQQKSLQHALNRASIELQGSMNDQSIVKRFNILEEKIRKWENKNRQAFEDRKDVLSQVDLMIQSYGTNELYGKLNQTPTLKKVKPI